MTARTRWSARLTVTALATAAIAAGTLVTAAPAQAKPGCAELMDKANVQFHLYEWYGIALGYDSKRAQAHLKTSGQMADFWMENC